MNFGAILWMARKNRGLTLEEVASRCGTHKGYISGIEGAKVSPPAARVTRKIAKVLGLPAAELVVLGCLEKAPAEVQRYLWRPILKAAKKLERSI